MKITPYIILLPILLTGCWDPIGQVTQDGRKTFTDSNNPSLYRDVLPAAAAGKLYRVLFEGHIYVIRDNGYQGGIAHDPDCPCTKKITLEKP